MALLTPDAIDDITNTTLKNYEISRRRGRWVDISLEFQEYVSMSSIWRDKKVRLSGGDQVSWVVQHKNTGNAINTGLYDVDTTTVEDVDIQATVPWTFQKTSFAYDVREAAFNRGLPEIISLIVQREHDAMNSYAELTEENLWSAPTGSTDKRPYGIPFWIQKDATTTVLGGFNGGDPSGFTGGAGSIDSDTYTRWKNWTFGYTQVSEDDLLKKVRRACRHTLFRAPHPFPEVKEGKDPSYEIYTTSTTIDKLEILAESRNDNLGSEMVKYYNGVMIRNTPVRWAPYLDTNDTTDPVYGINWAHFRPYIQTGWDMRRGKPLQLANQPNVRRVRWDTICNYINTNRRTQWVGSTS